MESLHSDSLITEGTPRQYLMCSCQTVVVMGLPSNRRNASPIPRPIAETTKLNSPSFTIDEYVFGWRVSGRPSICLITWAIGNQIHMRTVASVARTPHTTPATAQETTSRPTITIGLTSPPETKLSTAAIPQPTRIAIPARSQPLGIFMSITLRHKVQLVKENGIRKHFAEM